MSEEINYSKKNKRNLTPFIGEELLYEYLTDKLDDTRKQYVEGFLKDTKASQKIAQKIKNGLAYTEALSQTVVADQAVDEILNPKNFLQTLNRKFKVDKWPVGLRLSLQALIISITFAAIGLLIPWDKAFKLNSGYKAKPELLVEMQRLKLSTQSNGFSDFAQQNIQPIDAIYPDEGLSEKEAKRGQTESKTPTAPQLAAQEKNNTTVPAPMPAPDAAEKTQASVAKAEVTTKSVRGFLYRGFAKVDDLDTTTQDIKNKIGELGGIKAGQVDLGWQKDNTSSYFHFTIPESKYSEVISLFEKHGSFKVQKETHPRKLPDGVIRFIIIVQEANK